MNNHRNLTSTINTINSLRNKTNSFGFSPKQAKAVVGRLARGQEESFKRALVAWINEAEVNDDHRAAVAANRRLIEAQGRKPWDSGLDEGPAVLNENDKVRVSFAQAVAWAHAVQLETESKGLSKVLNARGNTRARGLLHKLGLSAQQITSRFPDLAPAASANRRRRGLSLDIDEAEAAPSRAQGREIKAAPAASPGFTQAELMGALEASGLDMAKAWAVAKAAPRDIPSLMDALEALEADAAASFRLIRALA